LEDYQKIVCLIMKVIDQMRICTSQGYDGPFPFSAIKASLSKLNFEYLCVFVGERYLRSSCTSTSAYPNQFSLAWQS